MAGLHSVALPGTLVFGFSPTPANAAGLTVDTDQLTGLDNTGQPPAGNTIDELVALLTPTIPLLKTVVEVCVTGQATYLDRFASGPHTACAAV